MISIVTPTYNSEQYLEDCIQSIMKQRYKDYEHIVVDGYFKKVRKSVSTKVDIRKR